MRWRRDQRGKVHLTDVIVVAAVAIVAYSLAPAYYELIGRIDAHADPLSGLLLELVVPIIFIGIVISLGVSARRRL